MLVVFLYCAVAAFADIFSKVDRQVLNIDSSEQGCYGSDKMNKNALIWSLILCLILPVLLVGLPSEIRRVNAQNTVYIRADGSVEPGTAPISTLDNATYTLTGNISETIVIERNDIVLEGAGYAVDGFGTLRGLDLTNVQNITVKEMHIEGFYYGVYLNLASRITVIDCNITMNAYDGINIVQSSQSNISRNRISSNGNDGLKILNSSSNNIIAENTITLNNDDGIQITDSPQNAVSGNTISQNEDVGIYALNSSITSVFGNTVMNNRHGLEISSSLSNEVKGNTFNSNSLYGIWVSSSSDNILDGNTANSNYDGVYAYQSPRNVFSGNEIQGNSEYGVWLDFSSDCALSSNNITGNNEVGVYVRFSSGTIISDNTLSSSNIGISLSGSSSNFILRNFLASNNIGVSLAFSSTDNQMYHNNFVGNAQQVSSTSAVTWENGLEGNYWSDYSGSDLDLNGIGDSPYVIDAGNDDDLPLLGMFHSFSTSLGHYVNIISNSTIDDFNYVRLPGNVSIIMHVSNMTSSQTAGLCRVTIPHSLMTEPFEVTMNGTQPNYANYTIYDNATHRWIYFDYNHSALEIVIQGTETTPPETSIVSPENITYATSDVPLVFTLSEPASWMGYSLDGQDNVTILGNTTLLGLSDGAHNVVVYANDTLGNMGSSNVIHFSIDTTPPSITILSPLNQTYQTDSIALTFTLDESASWIGYSLDGQANITVFDNTTLSDLADGNHDVVVCATDALGNTGISNTVYFSVDTAPPSVTLLSPLNQTYQTDSVTLTFTLNEPTSWIGYSLDGQANMTIFGNTTLLDLADGNHDVIVYATDTFGNTGISNMVYFSVDTTPPDIPNVSQYPPEDNVLPDDIVNVNATVTDNFSGVSRVTLNYTTDNGTWFSVEMSHLEDSIWNATIPDFPYGTTVNYTIIAEDNVGNSITSEDLAYTLQYDVIPEFASYIALLLLMTATLLAIALLRSKRISA